MATKTKNEETVIEIPKLELKEMALKLIGDSPLIVHAWDEKAKREMLEKQMKKATSGKKAKDPFSDFCNSLYWLSEKPENPTMEDVMGAKFGFPAVAFKSAAIDGGFLSGVTSKKTTSRAAFHIIGEMVEVKGIPEMREDMVRIGMGTADIRYRGEFKAWSVTLLIRYNETAMSAEQIINLFNYGGFGVGVGEWRPAKDGSYGRFHVATETE